MNTVTENNIDKLLEDISSIKTVINRNKPDFRLLDTRDRRAGHTLHRCSGADCFGNFNGRGNAPDVHFRIFLTGIKCGGVIRWRY